MATIIYAIVITYLNDPSQLMLSKSILALVAMATTIIFITNMQ